MRGHGALEIQVRSLRKDGFDEHDNEDCLRINLDLVEEYWGKVQRRVASYQQMMGRYYNRRVKEQPPRHGELCCER